MWWMLGTVKTRHAVSKCCHHSTCRRSLWKGKGGLRGGGETRSHLIWSNDRGIEWNDSCGREGRMHQLWSKRLFERFSKELSELLLAKSLSMQSLVLQDCLLPDLFQSGKAGNIETLQSVSAVWRVCQDNDVVIHGIAKKGNGEMRSVTIEEKDSSATCSLLGSLVVKVLDPLDCKFGVGPASGRGCKTAITSMIEVTVNELSLTMLQQHCSGSSPSATLHHGRCTLASALCHRHKS